MLKTSREGSRDHGDDPAASRRQVELGRADVFDQIDQCCRNVEAVTGLMELADRLDPAIPLEPKIISNAASVVLVRW